MTRQAAQDALSTHASTGAGPIAESTQPPAAADAFHVTHMAAPVAMLMPTGTAATTATVDTDHGPTATAGPTAVGYSGYGVIRPNISLEVGAPGPEANRWWVVA